MHGRCWIALLAASLAAWNATAQELPPADQAAALKAAGFNGEPSDCEEQDSASYTAPALDVVQDLNGDGRPDALISEGSTACYGMAGQGYFLVSQQADGAWKLLASGPGIVTFLPSKGANGWPDIEVGGPGFCFPVLRFDGREYQPHGQQYEGKPCKA